MVSVLKDKYLIKATTNNAVSIRHWKLYLVATYTINMSGVFLESKIVQFEFNLVS